MCGIAGFSCISEEYDNRLDIALVMLGLAMQDRGRQSWGWTDGEQVVKSTGAFKEGFNNSFFGFKKQALHTRHATTGSITEANAHPWKIGGLIGMHNGIVHNHDELNKKYERTCSVDSMHLFHHIDENKDLSEVSAYGAVCFFKDDMIHVGRFNNGDLHLVKTDTAWLFASTRNALNEALRFSGLKWGSPIFYKLKEGRCYRLNGGKLEISDINLNVGSYSKNYKTWQDGTGAHPTTSYTPRGGGAYNGYSVSDRRHGQQILLPGESSKDKEEPQQEKSKATKNGTTPTTQGVGGLRNRKSLGHLTLEERVTEITKEFVHRGRIKEQKEEADWKCGFCTTVLADGEKYFIAENQAGIELVCEDCAVRYSEELAYGPLTELPEEIMLVDAFLMPGDKNEWLDCDGCSEKLYQGEVFVETKEHDFYCINCFGEGVIAPAEGTLEENEEIEYSSEQERIQAAEDAYFNEQSQYFPTSTPNTESNQKWKQPETKPEDRKPIVVKGRVVPRVLQDLEKKGEDLNEAGSLKRFGSGFPTGMVN
jgi:hypothetical protein